MLFRSYQERDPKNYWKMVNELRNLEQENTNKADKIDPDIWLHHYRNLLYMENIQNRDNNLRDKLSKLESVNPVSQNLIMKSRI